MKKLLALLIASMLTVFCFTGCGSSEEDEITESTVSDDLSAEAETDDQGQKEDESELPLSQDFDEETNQYINYMGVECQIPASWEPASFNNYVYEFDGGRLSVSGTKEDFDAASSADQSSYIQELDTEYGSFKVSDRSEGTVMDNVSSYFVAFSGSTLIGMESRMLTGYVTAFSVNGYRFEFTLYEYSTSDYDHLTDYEKIIDSISSSGVVYGDFFDDSERQAKYEELYKSYQYSELYDYVNEYISSGEGAVVETDSAYSILELVEMALPYKDSWTVNYDDFDSTYSITFPGANEISGSTTVDVEVSGTSLTTKIGFQKTDWLFFDEYSISGDGNVIKSSAKNSYDVEKDVISGSTIEEYCLITLDDEEYESIKNSNTVVIRFTNTDNTETYDRTLSQVEKDALYCSYALQYSYRELSNLLSRYNNQ